MKFDYVIGNPPYQEETTHISETNGQLRSKSIFGIFQEEVDKIVIGSSVMIYPAGRWIQRSGKGMAKFGYNQLNDPHLSTLYVYRYAREVFSGADIGDGISIVVKNHTKFETGFRYIYNDRGQEIVIQMQAPGDSVFPMDPRNVSISEKLISGMTKHKLSPLHDAIKPQKLFSIESDFVSKNASHVREYNEGDFIDYSHEIKIFTNDKAGKAGRSKWYITNRSEITTGLDCLDKWKVVVSSANAGGQKRDNQLEIMDDHSAFGRSRVALRVFDTSQEAKNFYKYCYCKTYLIRFAFLLTDESLTTLALLVPDMEDYTDNNTRIDFSQNLVQCKSLWG